jgi:cytoskeletal protein CcmA (bactofilin family)
MFAKRSKRPAIELTQLSSLIAEDVEIVGDLHFSGGIRIDGHVKGNVIACPAEGKRALLVLSDKGRIEGAVSCGDAVINGSVVGDLVVEHLLELQSNARVRGTIRYAHLQMDVGAAVSGQLVQAEAGSAADNVVELGLERAGAAERR